MTAAVLPTFGLAITVAFARGGVDRAKDDAWIAAQVARANELLAPGDVAFRWTIEKAMGEEHAEIHTREDRDALGALTEKRDGRAPGVIDVFVVAMLEDVDEPGRHRKGVCWTQRQDKQRYIVLSAEAPIGVLGHELGHFFGNGHSKVPDNLMSYERTGGPVTLDDAQIGRIHELTTTFLTTGRLADVGPPRLLP